MTFVKRVIGVPGDHIRLIDGVVYVNGKAQREPYAVYQGSYPDSFRDQFPTGEYTDPGTGERRILGVGRMNKLHGRNEAEVAALVSDKYQKLGLGYELLRRVVQIARDEKLSLVSAEMLPDNIAMQAVFRRLGFRIRADEDLTSLRATLEL